MALPVPVRHWNKSIAPFTCPREPVDAIRCGAKYLPSMHLIHSRGEKPRCPLVDGDVLPFCWVGMVCYPWIGPSVHRRVSGSVKLGGDSLGIQVSRRGDDGGIHAIYCYKPHGHEQHEEHLVVPPTARTEGQRQRRMEEQNGVGGAKKALATQHYIAGVLGDVHMSKIPQSYTPKLDCHPSVFSDRFCIPSSLATQGTQSLRDGTSCRWPGGAISGPGHHSLYYMVFRSM